MHKPYAPKLSREDRQLLEENYLGGSPNMRFLYLSLAAPHLVVFNATLQQLCDPTQPPFRDFNGPCAAYYSPLHDIDKKSAATGC